MNKLDIQYIKSIAPKSLLINEPMDQHTTFGIGGIASCYFMPKNIIELKTSKKYLSLIIKFAP